MIYYVLFITIYYIFLFCHLLPFITTFITSFITTWIHNLGACINIYYINYNWCFPFMIIAIYSIYYRGTCRKEIKCTWNHNFNWAMCEDSPRQNSAVHMLSQEAPHKFSFDSVPYVWASSVINLIQCFDQPQLVTLQFNSGPVLWHCKIYICLLI